jgi:hypothetical protein
VVAVVGALVLERGRLRVWARPAAGAGLVALVAWAPVLLQQAFGTRGNLSDLLWFVRHNDQPKLGLHVATDQVVNTLGWPPLLGQRHLEGTWFFGSPSPLAWLTALAVVGLLVAAGWRWRGGRRRLALVAMTAAAGMGGLVDAASIPRGIEQYRLAFYHWAFVLSFFVGLSLVLLAGDVVRRLPRWAPAVGLVALVVPALVNPSLTRQSNTLLRAADPVPRQAIDRLADTVAADLGHGDGHAGHGPVVVFSTDDGPLNSGLREAMALALTTRGLDIVFPRDAVEFVDADRLAHRATVRSGLVLVPAPTDDPVPGRRVADVRTSSDGTRWRLQVYRLDRAQVLGWADDRLQD